MSANDNTNTKPEFLDITGPHGGCNETFRNPVTAMADQLGEQAHNTTAGYLAGAVLELDQRFGPGYAENHPELIGAFMQTVALSYQTLRLTQTKQEAVILLANTISVVSEERSGELDEISKDLKQIAEEVAR
jgi:hypothetical protein